MKKKKSTAQETARSASPTAEKPAEKTAKAKPTLKEPKQYVVIDYPVEGEIITSQRYTLRFGASPIPQTGTVPGGADKVEVSIDGRDWQPARESAGYWWFDWSGYSAGPHTIEARIPTGGKRYAKSKPRQFTVLI
ncbi:MAG: hypothetical protein HY548_08490 [Elusimicrobia bacterium]|nr:hypothetical protein [Elusimicrobiota bacterium]